jgi:hypothetical protein
MPYVATINVPGYLPEGDPVEFDTATDAWSYLADERMRHEDETEGDSYSDTYRALTDHSNLTAEPGTIYGPNPDADADHDLGLAYCVTETDE